MTDYIVAMKKFKGDGHTYILMYDDESYVDALAWPLRWWQDDSLEFTFADARAMSKRVREEGASV